MRRIVYLYTCMCVHMLLSECGALMYFSDTLFLLLGRITPEVPFAEVQWQWQYMLAAPK